MQKGSSTPIVDVPLANSPGGMIKRFMPIEFVYLHRHAEILGPGLLVLLRFLCGQMGRWRKRPPAGRFQLPSGAMQGFPSPAAIGNLPAGVGSIHLLDSQQWHPASIPASCLTRPSDLGIDGDFAVRQDGLQLRHARGRNLGFLRAEDPSTSLSFGALPIPCRIPEYHLAIRLRVEAFSENSPSRHLSPWSPKGKDASACLFLVALPIPCRRLEYDPDPGLRVAGKFRRLGIPASVTVVFPRLRILKFSAFLERFKARVGDLGAL